MKKKPKESSVDFSKMSVQDIVDMKTQIESLLANLEDEYRKASISEASYKEIKEKNLKRLEEVKHVLKDMGMGDVADKPPEPKPDGAEPQSSPPQFIPQDSAQPLQQTRGTAYSQIQGDSFQAEVIENKFKVEIEKLKIMIDSIKETRAITEDKIQRLTESIGELRSLVYQRENAYKDEDIKIEKFEQALTTLNPQRIEKEFAKRDKESEETGMRIEKLEAKQEDLIKTTVQIQSIMKSLGGLENISEVNKEIAEKLQQITAMTKSNEKLTDRVQKLYVELNKKLEDVIVYKSKQDNLDELVKELMKNMDDIIVKSENFVLTKDINALREDLLSIDRKFSEIKRSIDILMPIVKSNVPDSLKEKQRNRDDMKALVSSLEQSYRQGSISEQEYKNAKEKNLSRMQKIEEEIAKEWEKFRFGTKPGKKEEETEEKKEIKAEDKSFPEPKEEKDIAAQSNEINLPSGEKTATKEPQFEGEIKADKQTSEKPLQDEKSPQEKPLTTPAITEERKEQKPQASEEIQNENKLMRSLKFTFEKGLISKETYERTMRMLAQEQ